MLYIFGDTSYTLLDDEKPNVFEKRYFVEEAREVMKALYGFQVLLI